MFLRLLRFANEEREVARRERSVLLRFDSERFREAAETGFGAEPSAERRTKEAVERRRFETGGMAGQHNERGRFRQQLDATFEERRQVAGKSPNFAARAVSVSRRVEDNAVVNDAPFEFAFDEFNGVVDDPTKGAGRRTRRGGRV